MAKKSKPNPRYTSKKAGKIKPNLLAMRKARRHTIRERKRLFKSSKGGRKMGGSNIFNFNPFSDMLRAKPKSKYHN